MNLAKSEFTADLLLYVLMHEPEVPLYMTLFVSEVNGEKEPQLRTHEVNDPNFCRHRVKFSPINCGFVKLLHDVQFPRATKPWGRVTHFAIYDAQKGGNLLLLKPTGGVTGVDVGEIIAILAAEFSLFVGFSPYLAMEIAA
jgi:hypothetical protein